MHSSPYRASGSDYQPLCDRQLTNIIRDLASNENQIELRRQDLCSHPDFEPMKLFQLIDVSRDGLISATELTDWMSRQYLGARLTDAQDIIREYDGNYNGYLDFDEFCQLVLPSTNQNLRSIASSRRSSPYFRASAPLPYEVISLAARLLDKEMQLQRGRSAAQRDLERCPDFIKVRTFDTIARGYHSISVPDLIFYLERNGFYARRDDIEAILRRLDHDANRMISYTEFCELASVQDRAGRGEQASASRQAEQPVAAEADSARQSAAEGEAKDEAASEAKDFNVEQVDEENELRGGAAASEEKQEASAEKKQASPTKSAAKKRVQNSEERQKRQQEIEEAAQKEREEIEKRLEEDRKKAQEEYEARKKQETERLIECTMFLRLVKLIVNQSRVTENAKEVLNSHRTFSCEKGFALLDKNREGKFAMDEILHVFAFHGIEVDSGALEGIVELIDDDEDGTIDFREWQAAVSPSSPSLRDQRCAGDEYGLTDEQKKLHQQSWLEALATLFTQLVSEQQEVQAKAEDLCLDGERIWNQIDTYRMGAVSVHSFAHWISANCGFTVADSDMAALQRAFGKGARDYRISKENFLAFVNPQPEEEEENAEEEAEESKAEDAEGQKEGEASSEAVAE